MARRGQGTTTRDGNAGNESQPIIIKPYMPITISTGHHNNPARAPAHVADDESDSEGASPPPQAGNDRQVNDRGGRQRNGRRSRQADPGRQQDDQGRQQNGRGPRQADPGRPQDERRLRVVRELGQRLAAGKVPLGQRRQTQGQRQQQAGNMPPAGGNQPPGFAARQRAENDFRDLIDQVERNTALFKTIAVHDHVVRLALTGRFQYEHVMLWNEVIQSIRPYFSANEQRVVIKMII